MRGLFLLFVVVPLVEMIVLIKVGGVIGAIPTVALVCLTAFVGVSLIRAQGFSTLQRAQSKMQHGEMPAQEMVDGICLAVGGAMLLTPGFLTDAMGFLLLIPGLRKRLLALFVRNLSFRASVMGSQSYEHSTKQKEESSTLEGEYWKEK